MRSKQKNDKQGTFLCAPHGQTIRRPLRWYLPTHGHSPLLPVFRVRDMWRVARGARGGLQSGGSGVFGAAQGTSDQSEALVAAVLVWWLLAVRILIVPFVPGN